MWFDWKPVPPEQLKSLSDLCPSGEYRVLSQEQIPDGVISPTLKTKLHNVLIMCSGDATTGRLYTMLNYNRVDGDEIDQMPYGIAYDGSGPIPSGVLVQHGDYENRTTPLPEGFHEFVAQSGMYPLQEMPTNPSGRISDLNIGSQQKGFELLRSQIDLKFPPEDSNGGVEYRLV
ncbi:MAG UNVERIFIED_CONTAM: hypothetical protein LVR18_28130 [Planctomycetaceae bacterium]|jgi:hypothetical protein